MELFLVKYCYGAGGEVGGRSLAVNRGQKRPKKVSCSDKGDTFLTAAFFNFPNAFGF